MDFLTKLSHSLQSEKITPKVFTTMQQLYLRYQCALEQAGLDRYSSDPTFDDYLARAEEQIAQPFSFLPYHQKITSPFDYYHMGLDFIRPLVDLSRSHILHPENLSKIAQQIEAGENAILFANHQSEVDPQAMSLILERQYPHLAKEVIFVAGDRVLTDPMAVPFSMGRNLLCIHSKKYISHPPERRLQKQEHNRKTMQRMSSLLKEGGCFIYVAPSGGRDRPNAQQEVEVAPFDPQSIEMFRLMAKQAGTSTHFYPLALSTFALLPPPETVNQELGEPRLPQRSGAQFAFGEEINMEHFPGAENPDRHERREALALYIWNLVRVDYQKLLSIL